MEHTVTHGTSRMGAGLSSPWLSGDSELAIEHGVTHVWMRQEWDKDRIYRERRALPVVE